MENSHQTLLTAPAPELGALSFAAAEPGAVSDWITHLPMANVTDTAGQIRQASFEIARLDTDWSTRMELLEAVRPTVLYLTGRLDKAASSAGNQADAITRLAQRLQTNLSSGYKAVILDAVRLAADDTEAHGSVSLAIHRAISDLSKTLLRTLQYYVAPADNLWLNLNQLYFLAEQLGFDGEVQADAENDTQVELSISGAYLRSLLLALARPYQLRHRQLFDVFKALGSWVHMVSLSGSDGQDLYMVDLRSDQGPGYASSFAAADSTRGIRSEVLVYELEAYLRDMDGSIVIPSDFDDALIHHLVDAWGEMKPRAFNRSESVNSIKLCVGSRATHYFLSGGRDFADLVGTMGGGTPREINPFMNEDVRFLPNADETKDVWEDAFDVTGRIPENPKYADKDGLLYSHEPSKRSDPASSFRCYDTIAVDMSPGGYRLRWKEPFPANLQTGELIGLRDETDPRWCVAIARWIRQDEAGPYMGVELLAPQAKPVAVKLIQTKGGPVEYQRAFLLPELKPIGQAATLITPANPFKAGQKVQLCDEGIQNIAQLGDCLLRTDSFNQFTFRVLDGYLAKPASQPTMLNPEEFGNKQKTGSR